MIYLDNAATTMPKPPGVQAAVREALEHCASLGRSGHQAARRAAETAYACRSLAGKMFDTEAERVVFTLNATHGLNMAIRTLVKPGDRVVVSGYEHNAVLRPLHHLGANIQVARSPLFDSGRALEAFEQAIDNSTKTVICCHASNVFGCVLPLEEIAALCRDRGVPLIVDAAQSAGILPLSMKNLGAAFIAMPGHKGLYGPQGTGLLLCGQLPEPLMQGGTGSLSRSLEMPDFLPDRGEAGTQNMPGIAGLLAGLEFVQSYGIQSICEHETQLLEHLQAMLSDIPGVQTFFNPINQTGVLSFAVRGMDCEIMGQWLADRGFAIRAGLHCAPLAHDTVGTLNTGTVRVSVSAFNTMEEVEAFAEVIEELKNAM